MHWDQNGPEQRSSRDFADWNSVLVKMCKNFRLFIFILVSHCGRFPSVLVCTCCVTELWRQHEHHLSSTSQLTTDHVTI